jgi:hypothetical protein
MREDSQVVVPEAFVALFKPARALKPTEPWDVIVARHELCEDMAQMLTETARLKLFELGIAECDVLERVRQGLLAEGSVVSPAEAWWITGRLAELLDWPLPESQSEPPAAKNVADARQRGPEST